MALRCARSPMGKVTSQSQHHRTGLTRLVVRRAGEDKSVPREIGCSELYNMTESISRSNDALGSTPGPTATTTPSPSGPTKAASSPAASGPAAAATTAPAGVKAPSSAGPDKIEYGAQYYQGLLTTDIAEKNNATAADMLKRSLQFAGGAAGLIGGLLLAFMASNGLL